MEGTRWSEAALRGVKALATTLTHVDHESLALPLEESIQHGLRWAADEPNGELLWAEVRQRVDVFLHDLFRRGAIQGHAPRDAHFVRCDRSTMTQLDIDEGRLIVIVGFAPLKPAEFVVVNVRQPARRRDG